MSRFAVASLLLVAVLRNLVASESAGITNIVATGDKIIISGDTGKDAAGIFEIMMQMTSPSRCITGCTSSSVNK